MNYKADTVSRNRPDFEIVWHWIYLDLFRELFDAESRETVPSKQHEI